MEKGPLQVKLDNLRICSIFWSEFGQFSAQVLTKIYISGDGGSPLVCPVSNGQYVQTGIVRYLVFFYSILWVFAMNFVHFFSWGIGCGENETPAVYVNVPIFRHWIDEQMKLAHLTTSTYNRQILRDFSSTIVAIGHADVSYH